MDNSISCNPSLRWVETAIWDLEQAVLDRSDLPVPQPSPLDKFIYWLTPTVLRYYLKAQNQKAEVRYLRRSLAFDPEWYLARNPDVAMQNVDPAMHYVKHGESEGARRRHFSWWMSAKCGSLATELPAMLLGRLSQAMAIRVPGRPASTHRQANAASGDFDLRGPFRRIQCRD